MITPDCHKCNTKENVKMRYQITASGTYQYSWYCLSCECWTPMAKWIKHELIKGKLPPEFYRVGLIVDYRKEPCVICGDVEAELHHIAPQSLKDYFGETWSKWPTFYLCRTHHRMWHELTTPFLPGYRDSERARAILEKFGKTERV